VSLGNGEDHRCVAYKSGKVACWGYYNSSGQLGDGTKLGSSKPVAVVGLPGPAVEVSAGEGASCARIANGEVWCWGRGQYGQLGYGEWWDSWSPVQVKDLKGAVALARSWRSFCALRVDGSVWCWGTDGASSGVWGAGNTPVPKPIKASLPP